MKKLYVIFIIIIISLLVFYFIGQKEVEAVTVTVEITKGAPFNASLFNESERGELIGDITFKKIHTKNLAIPKSNGMYKPGINVGLFSNKIMISDWASVSLRDKGIYELTMRLKQPAQKNDTIRIAVYVNDDKGKQIIGKKKDVIWD